MARIMAVAGSAGLLFATFSCGKSHPAAHQTSPSAKAPAVSSVAPQASNTPRGCQASGTKPARIGIVLGDVFGFGQDGTRLYYTSWQAYGERGDVGTIRKDGHHGHTLGSLSLQPRSLAVGASNIYYTSGIHLFRVAKTGGTPNQLVDIFSSKSIALGSSDVYGVPGDYGPYDRLAKVSKKGGSVVELATDKRPKLSQGPNGYSRVLIDGSTAFVTDSGHDRVLAFPLPKGKRKVIASHVKQPFALAAGGSNLYFDLGVKGELMSVPKSGGRAKKLASGLPKNALIAADARTVYAPFAGAAEDAPEKLSAVSTSDGKVTPIATVPALEPVSAIAVDNACVYWAVTVDATKSIVYAEKRR